MKATKDVATISDVFTRPRLVGQREVVVHVIMTKISLILDNE